MFQRRLILILVFLLAGCVQTSQPYTPVSPADIIDNWQITVASTGDVDLTRRIILDASLSPYLRGSTQLDNAPLLETLPTETLNKCTLIQAEQQVEYSCRMAYTTQIIPTESKTTLTLPEDHLLRFITDLLGYQPIPVQIVRKISISVPGRVIPLDVDEKTYFPVYSQIEISSHEAQESQLIIASEIVLAPGDLPNPRLQRLPAVQFESILGFRQ
ncbi:MAG: hypothetical protein KDE48_19075 [Anaerolineales bacterium]|nr:hypothetical protein [Anaerolineales bacterium]